MILVPGKGKDVLVSLINQQNVLPYPILSDDVIFSAPKLVQGVNPTAVAAKVMAIPGGTYDGLFPVEWQRMDLTSAFGDIIPHIKGLSNGNLHSMLPYIGQELGIELYPEDFLQVDYSNLGENEQVNIQLTATVTSLSYVGSFIIQFTRLRPNLTDQVKITALDVFQWPGWTKKAQGVAEKKQLSMDIYSQDWTEFADTLQKHYYYSIWADPTAVRTLMSSKGYPNWPIGFDNGIGVYLTSQVPEANQDYDRVIVQKIRDIAGAQVLPYEGTAYFHYNVT